MRRLFFGVLLIAACTTSSPKYELGEMDIDVLWEEQAVPAHDDALLVESEEKAAASEASAPEVEVPALHTSTYYLTWQGKRIGQARERFHRSKSGVRIIRSEEIRVLRGGVVVESETEIIITADANLHATRVELRAQAGAITRTGHALRADDGRWVIALEGEKVRKAPADAVPLELVPYLVGKRGVANFSSKVLLAGYGFAVTEMQLDHEGKRGRAILRTEWGDIETSLVLGKNGKLVRASTGSTGSVRVGAARLKEKFVPPELPGNSAIPVRGKAGKENVLVVGNTNRQPPPAIGGQSISLRKSGWRIQFDVEPGQVSKRVARLAREVDSLLQDSHDAPGAGASDALELGRGDCTAHATLFIDLAAEQGIEAKLVTGYRLDGANLLRHRWVVVHQGSAWVQVDPTFGEAPVTPGNHLALAVHGDSTAEIALVDEAVFRGLGRARARWVGARASVAHR